MADVIFIQMDSAACGRPITETVKALETYGEGVSDAVKAMLGLIPPVN